MGGGGRADLSEEPLEAELWEDLDEELDEESEPELDLDPESEEEEEELLFAGIAPQAYRVTPKEY